MSSVKKAGIAVIGTGQRAPAFAVRVQRSEWAELTGLCDIDKNRLDTFIKRHEMKTPLATTNIDDILNDPATEAVVVTVPDHAHCEIAVRCFKAGKHVMLEKPMALTVQDAKDILKARNEAKKIMMIGFVLRCTPFYSKIKDIIDSGQLGTIMSISGMECLNVLHSSSYMRRWHRKGKNSGSFLLTKCSHDLDMLMWLAGGTARRVASFGENNFFDPSKQPASHCSKCDDVHCPYRFDKERSYTFMTDEDLADPTKRNFDLCVYNDDKDVVDNQVCILEMENKIRSTFSLQLFHHIGTRRITITGTSGILTGDMHKAAFTFTDTNGHQQRTELSRQGGGHFGGDDYFVDKFIHAVRSDTQPAEDLMAGLASTVTGVAIETARREGRVVEIPASDYEL